MLNRRMEELSRDIKNFGRYVVELTKPVGRLLQNKWFWIIIVILVVILGLLFAPAIIKSFMTTWEGATNAGGPIVPR